MPTCNTITNISITFYNTHIYIYTYIIMHTIPPHSAQCNIIIMCALPTLTLQHHHVCTPYSHTSTSLSTLSHPIIIGMCIPRIPHMHGYIYYTILTINTQHIYLYQHHIRHKDSSYCTFTT